MRTRITMVQQGAAALIVAFAVTGCGAGGGGNGPQAGGDVVDGGSGELALPVTATYGYVDLTVESMEIPDQAPEGVAVAEPATYVSMELTLTNPARVTTFHLPPDLFTLVTGGGDRERAVTEQGEGLEVEPQSNTTETLWFVLPEGAEVTDPQLEVLEGGHQPLSISLTGAPAPPEQVSVTMEGTFETECDRVEFGTGIASYNAEIAADSTAPNASDLGRAADGEVLVTFEVSATESCPGPVTFYSLRTQIRGLIVQPAVGDFVVPTTDDLGQVDGRTSTGYLAAAVPADATEPLVIEWWDYYTETTSTTSAPLDAIAELTTS